MPTKCYSGIEVPQQIQEPCLGKYTSTDCSLSPNANIILDLPSGASQTETNAALTTALVYKEQQIEDLQNSILTIDGSETKVEAGDNVTVTGTGTNLNPYIVNAVIGVNQDLQSVLDTGNYAEDPSGYNFVSLLTLKTGQYSHVLSIESPTVNDLGCYFSMTEEDFYINNRNGNLQRGSFISLVNGDLSISKNFLSGTTVLKIQDPLVNTNLNFPSKTVLGDYTINTTDDIIYTVSTLPSATLNDMAIVSDALAPVYLGALTGGGTVVTPVWYNGTIWVSR